MKWYLTLPELKIVMMRHFSEHQELRFDYATDASRREGCIDEQLYHLEESLRGVKGDVLISRENIRFDTFMSACCNRMISSVHWSLYESYRNKEYQTITDSCIKYATAKTGVTDLELIDTLSI